MMRYPISIYENRMGSEVLFAHPDLRDDVSVYLRVGWWGVAWSDGTVSAYQGRAEVERMWVDYVTGGAAFTDYVRETVREELASLARTAPRSFPYPVR